MCDHDAAVASDQWIGVGRSGNAVTCQLSLSVTTVTRRLAIIDSSLYLVRTDSVDIDGSRRLGLEAAQISQSVHSLRPTE